MRPFFDKKYPFVIQSGKVGMDKPGVGKTCEFIVGNFSSRPVSGT